MTRAGKLWGWTLTVGVLLLVSTAIVFAMLPEGSPDVAPGWGGAIYAIEFARTVGEMEAALGDAPGARGELAHGTLADFGYLLHYALFMAFFAWAALRSGGPGWLSLAILAAVVAGAADAVENTLILGAFEGEPSDPLNAWIAAYVKFAAIAISIAWSAAFMTTRPDWTKWLGIAALVGAVATIVGLAAPSKIGFLLGNGIGLGWIAMLVFAGVTWRQHKVTSAFSPARGGDAR